MSTVIDIRGVEKTYKRRIKALRGVDMTVGKGEIFGLLGPNGAGKSTLVKIMMTVISPSKCSGTVLGQKVGDKATLRNIGYLPEHHRFPPYLTGRQVLEHFGAMSGIKRKQRKTKASELLELVGMESWHKDKLGSYSKGMRQRVGLAQALMNDPQLVVLDEPTDGVDPLGRRDIRNILMHLKGEGRTIFLNSHLLSELEMVCDRVAIMVKGMIRQHGTINDLTNGLERYEIELQHPENIEALSTQLGSLLQIGSPSVTSHSNTITIPSPDVRQAQQAIDFLRKQDVAIVELRQSRPSLEDLFVKAVESEPDGHTPGAISGSKGANS